MGTLSGERTFQPGLLSEVPAFPAVAIKAMQFLSKDRGQLNELGEVVASDPAISSGILRMANSALFGLRTEVRGIQQAIHLLGLERVKAVVVTVAMISYLDGSLAEPALRACWRHSLACALLCEEFAQASLLDPGIAYTAGLMHDVGRMALVAGYPKEYREFLPHAESAPCDILQGERDLFGIDHCQAGLLLVVRWQLPRIFREVVALHHNVPAPGEAAVLSTVRHACAVADALGFSAARALEMPGYDQIVVNLPERERNSLPKDPEEIMRRIAHKINSIECS